MSRVDIEHSPTPGSRRRDRLAEQLFTGMNMAVFVVLMSCVGVAAVLWEQWH